MDQWLIHKDSPIQQLMIGTGGFSGQRELNTDLKSLIFF